MTTTTERVCDAIRSLTAKVAALPDDIDNSAGHYILDHLHAGSGLLPCIRPLTGMGSLARMGSLKGKKKKQKKEKK